MEELAEMTLTGEAEGHVIFILHHADTRAFMPNFHTDPDFARTMDDLSDILKFHAVSVATDREGEVHLVNAGLPVLPAPREALEKDRGVYLIMVELKKAMTIKVGALGDIHFPEGWYVYTGSARRGLKARVERHLRKRKNKRWHIDYLTSEAEVKKGVPIYTNRDLECDLAREAGRAAEREIPGFGCSDCGCSSHLFYFARSPLASRLFLDTLFRFRHRLCFDPPLLIHDLKNKDNQKKPQ
jgi:sugar fermentation stimulation protein A